MVASSSCSSVERLMADSPRLPKIVPHSPEVCGVSDLFGDHDAVKHLEASSGRLWSPLPLKNLRPLLSVPALASSFEVPGTAQYHLDDVGPYNSSSHVLDGCSGSTFFYSSG